MNKDDKVLRWQNCPRCDGRGYFLINPFIPRFADLTAPENLRQCETCLKAKAFWNQYGREPTKTELEGLFV